MPRRRCQPRRLVDHQNGLVLMDYLHDVLCISSKQALCSSDLPGNSHGPQLLRCYKPGCGRTDAVEMLRMCESEAL